MYNKQVHRITANNPSKGCKRRKYNENGDFAMVCPCCGKVFRFTGKVSFALNVSHEESDGFWFEPLFSKVCECGYHMINTDPNIARSCSIAIKNKYDVIPVLCQDGDKDTETILIFSDNLPISILNTLPDGWRVKISKGKGTELVNDDEDIKSRFASLNKWLTEQLPCKY